MIDSTNYDGFIVIRYGGIYSRLAPDTFPAFFNAEVLLRYKYDPDRYEINSSSGYIECKDEGEDWFLNPYGVNAAGQVYTILYRLKRSLPPSEQAHWKHYNESPKADIPEAMFRRFYEGEWADSGVPLDGIMGILESNGGSWVYRKVDWWCPPTGSCSQRFLGGLVNVPSATNRREWGKAFQDLAMLIIEGFKVRTIRSWLDAKGIEYLEKDGSLMLLEKVISKHSDGETNLEGLREVQRIRNAYSHRGSRARQLAEKAMNEYGSYTNHFHAVCKYVACELELIEEAFSIHNRQ